MNRKDGDEGRERTRFIREVRILIAARAGYTPEIGNAETGGAPRRRLCVPPTSSRRTDAQQ